MNTVREWYSMRLLQLEPVNITKVTVPRGPNGDNHILIEFIVDIKHPCLDWIQLVL